MAEKHSPDVFVFDIEGNGLLRDITRIHCLVAYNTKTKETLKITDPRLIKNFFLQDKVVFVGHNIVTYDIPAVEKIYGIEVKSLLIDTLGISWYLNSSTGRQRHGLAEYGEEFGVPKPPVDDWQGLSEEEYSIIDNRGEGWEELQVKLDEFLDIMLHRCQEDVKINSRLWNMQQNQLVEIYGKGQAKKIQEMLQFITFKMWTLRQQESLGIRLDLDQVFKGLEELGELFEGKYKILEDVMPKVIKTSIKKKPSVMYKKDGDISVAGQKWIGYLQEAGFEGTEEDVTEVELIDSFEIGNPNSPEQLKAWLYDLGWVPKHLKRVRDKKTGDTREIPQIKSKDDDSELCDSIKDLFPKAPELEELDSYSRLKHRLGILKGFINDSYYGRLYGSAMGFTNTMRLKHRVLVNLPGAHTQYGEYIRSCLVADEGCVLYSADVSSLEDNTKMHFVQEIDPDFVKALSDPRYDAHIAISVKAGLITQEEGDFFTWLKEGKDDGPVSDEFRNMSDEDQKEYSGKLSEKRHIGKQANFACVYGVGAPTLADQTGMKVKDAKNLIEAYWKINWSVKAFADSLETKRTSLGLWLHNPGNGFWYSLRSEKDKFSCVNQSMGDYVFNVWLKNCYDEGVKNAFSMHDEHNGNCKIGEEEELKAKVDRAMAKTNEQLKLNVTIRNSIDFGQRYIDIH